MKQFILDLIRDDSNLSMTRFLAMFSVIMAGGIAVYGMSKGVDLNALSMLVGVFLAAGFTGKVSQKMIESKDEKAEKD
jgi:hypothetical protein